MRSTAQYCVIVTSSVESAASDAVMLCLNMSYTVIHAYPRVPTL